MSKRYHVVVSRIGTANWGVEFGDYSHTVAKDELNDMKEHDAYLPRDERRSFKLLTVNGDTQSAIDAKVATLNNGG